MSSRYRRLMFEPGRLSDVSGPWAESIKPLHRAWRSGAVTDAEAAALYLLLGLEQREPEKWLGGPSPSGRPAPRGGPLLREWLAGNKHWRRWLDDSATVWLILHGFSLRGVRMIAREALLDWQIDPQRLILTDRVPSADEMLNLQAGGRRYVSCLFQREELAAVAHDGRDALSLFLHDLGHAGQFFADEDRRLSQIGIYRLLQSARNAGLLDRPGEYHLGWHDELDYLVADINTHPAHFWSVFWAKSRHAFGAEARQAVKFQEWREELYRHWHWSDDLIAVHEGLSSPIRSAITDRLTDHMVVVGSG